jgi:hypothetical protein
MSINCYKCNTETGLELHQSISRNEECPKCSADLRCCKMCEFYDPKAYNEFCDHFRLGSIDSSSNAKDDVMAQANALFKK